MCFLSISDEIEILDPTPSIAPKTRTAPAANSKTVSTAQNPKASDAKPATDGGGRCSSPEYTIESDDDVIEDDDDVMYTAPAPSLPTSSTRGRTGMSAAGGNQHSQMSSSQQGGGTTGQNEVMCN